MEQVMKYLAAITDGRRQADAKELLDIMQEETGSKPAMWGSSIIGFGTHHYKYESGREGDTVAVGFAPRKQALVIYGLFLYEQNAEEVSRLGRVTMGKGCVYIKSLAEIDEKKLRELIRQAFVARNNVS